MNLEKNSDNENQETNKDEKQLDSEQNELKQENTKKDQVPELANKEDESKKYPDVSYFKLQFSLMDGKMLLFFILGIFGATVMGVSFPIFNLIFGDTMNDLSSDDRDTLSDNIGSMSKKIIWCGLGMLGGTTLNILFSTLTGELIIRKIKYEYFSLLMNQEQGFFDSRNAFEFSTKVQAQIKQISSGLGQKVGNAVFSLSQFISAYIVGFIVSWKLSLVMLSLVPFIVYSAYFMIAALTDSAQKSRKYFEEAGGIAEEILYNIKTVASFGNLSYEKKRFKDKIMDSLEKGKYGGMMSSLARASIFFLVFASYALAIGVGAKFIHDEVMNKEDDLFKVGDIITIIWTIIFGSFSLGQSAPNIKAIAAACEASKEFFYLKERKPDIDTSESTQKPDSNELRGKVEFKEVQFAYPSKKERIILNKLNINFEERKKTAIVGQTGSGKSTIVNLIERLYDTTDGEVLVDGLDIRKYDVEYLRSLIGYVPQEPILLNTTIKENIIFGRKNVTDEEIHEACKKAFLYDFIDKLDKKLDTRVGLKGSRLSGGQKQRVAIARAILKKPKILILDEATSALDYKSEKIVKKALDLVSENVTTIIIAHRLSTVRNADKIIVLDNGEIKEEGTHDSLFALKRLYYVLVKNQETADNNSDNKEKDEGKEEINVIINEEINKSLNEIKEEQLQRQVSNASKLSKNSKLSKISNKIADKIEQNEIKLEIQRKKALLEDETLSIEQRKKILEEQDKLQETQFKSSKSLLWPIMCENPKTLIIATISSCVNGAVWPVYGYLIAETVFKLSDDDLEEVLDNGIFLVGMFILIACISGIATFFVGNLFTIMGEYLAMRMREKCYDKYLSLHMGFYDYAENSPGALLTKLASDTIKINGIALSMCSVIFETVVTLIIGCALGFAYCWQLALITLVFIPFMVIAMALGTKMNTGFAKNDEIKEKDLGNMLSESVTNTKTLYCFNMQSTIKQMYHNKIEEGGVHYFSYTVSAFVSGISQFLTFAVYAVTFYVGSLLIEDEDYDLNFGEMLKSIFSLMFAAFGVGMVTQYLGDMDEAKKSIISLFNLLSTDTEIDPEEVENKVIADENNFTPKIEFINVCFRYPTRPDSIIFENLSFIIESGQQVAFVGFSGSGKSTIIQLILRFYDINDGKILINDVDIRDYNLLSLRKMMGIVMQEPILFKVNVYNNIKYGNLENNSNEKIISCAQKALVPRIESITEDNKDALPVSGGEKQRIAIARCMLRDPKILLLDEATSALDKNVEEEIQKSLDVLMEGRTSIVIAHRLSTIINCTKIFFLEQGKILEAGTHNELMLKKERYHSLFVSGQNDKTDIK